MSPAHLQGSPVFHLERDTLMAELACIRRDVPTEVMAATTCPEVADGDTVVLATDDTVDYVDIEKTVGGFTYHELGHAPLSAQPAGGTGGGGRSAAAQLGVAV
eukprot:5894499-Prymnesium_polylepis.1